MAITLGNTDINNALFFSGTDVGIGTSSPTGMLHVNGISRFSTSVIDLGALELNVYGNGDRASLVDFHASGAPGTLDYSARILRDPGVNGDLLITNTGLQNIYLRPINADNSHGVLIQAGNTGQSQYFFRSGRLDCINSGQTAWATAVIRANACLIRTADDVDRLSVGQNGRVVLQNGSSSRGFTGNPIATQNDTVAGAIRAPGYIEWTTDIGPIGTTYFGSDIRKKTNIEQSGVASLDVIKQVEFISFDWKPESGSRGHVDLGVSAQQLQTVNERFVNEMSDGSLMVSEPALIPYLMKAIKELSEQVDILKSEIEVLKGV